MNHNILSSTTIVHLISAPKSANNIFDSEKKSALTVSIESHVACPYLSWNNNIGRFQLYGPIATVRVNYTRNSRLPPTVLLMVFAIITLPSKDAVHRTEISSITDFHWRRFPTEIYTDRINSTWK